MGATTKSSLKAAVKRKKAIQTEHFVPVDDAQAEQLKLADQRLALARFSGNADDVAKFEGELAALHAEVRKTGCSFIIKSVGRVAFEELVRDHPPTPEQFEENEASFDPETFWPALCSASIAGGMTPEEWKAEVFDSPDWGPGELTELRNKVMAVNTGSRIAQLGN